MKENDKYSHVSDSNTFRQNFYYSEKVFRHNPNVHIVIGNSSKKILCKCFLTYNLETTNKKLGYSKLHLSTTRTPLFINKTK